MVTGLRSSVLIQFWVGTSKQAKTPFGPVCFRVLSYAYMDMCVACVAEKSSNGRMN